MKFSKIATSLSFVLIAVTLVFAFLFIGCKKADQGPMNAVTKVLTNALIISDPSNLDAFIQEGPESEKGKAFSDAKTALEKLFSNDDVRKAVLANLRLYKYKDFESLKTVDEEKGTFVVMYLRSDSTIVGQKFEDRPGWRKGLFQVEQNENGWVISDMDNIISKLGTKPVSLDDKIK